MSSALFSPIELAELRLPNRIAVSPMCMYSAQDGLPGSWHQLHLGNLSLSGAGLMILEATAVEARGRISPACLGLYDDRQEEALSRLVARIRENSDIAIGVQLGHAGRKGSRLVSMPRGSRGLEGQEGGWRCVGPSALAYGPGWQTPDVLDAEGLETVRDAFVEAARRADRCGFDLIEVHAAHGYLLHQFVAPNSNRREDAYGGSREARQRFPLEVLAAMRAALPAAKPLGVRVNGADWHENGVTIEDTIAYAARMKEIGVDYVTASGGAGSPRIKPPPVEPGYMVPFAESVRAATGMRTMAVGMIVTPRQAEAVIAEGRADMIAIGRGFLDDPRWAIHAAAALGESTRYPAQYEKARPQSWPGYRLAHG